MLETIEQVNEANRVINGIDNPNLLSVDSTAVLPTKVDKVDPKDETGDLVAEPTPAAISPATPAPGAEVKKEEVVVKKEEKKEEKKVEEGKKPLQEKEVKVSDAVQKRFDEITKSRRTAERERDFEREQKRLEKERADKLEEELQQLKSKVDPAASGKPQKADFEDVEDYVEALTAWKVEQALRAKTEEVKKVEVEAKVKQEKFEVYEELDEALSRGRLKYDDFNEVALNKEVKITPELVETILDSEIAEDVMYYLGKNPEEAADLSKLSPRRAAREVTKIEAKLLAEANADKRAPAEKAEEIKKVTPNPSDVSITTDGIENPPPKKVPEAPEPITPVRTTGAYDKDPNQMSAKEYRAWRERNKG
jgi:hypothetical protein